MSLGKREIIIVNNRSRGWDRKQDPTSWVGKGGGGGVGLHAQGRATWTEGKGVGSGACKPCLQLLSGPQEQEYVLTPSVGKLYKNLQN